MTGPSNAGMVSQDMAATRSALPTRRSSRSRPTGTIMAPPMPCTMRAATSVTRLWEMPQRIEAKVKTMMAARNTVLRAVTVGHPATGRE